MSTLPVDGTSGIRSSSTIKRTAKGGSTKATGFADHISKSDAEDAVSSVYAPATASSVSGILGLQEVDDALARASRGTKRAGAILNALDKLHMALINGELNKATLENLARIAASHMEEVQDERLRELLWSIDLRAQVELAKFDTNKLDG